MPDPHREPLPPGSAPLLKIVDLETHFRTPRGIVRAVDGVSFSLDRGRTLGIVGESGSGKSVLSRTIIDILAQDGSVRTRGQVLFEGRDLRRLSARDMRDVRGQEIAMIFQDPMTSLNPVMKIGKQLTEVLTKRRGYRPRPARKRAVELLNAVGIPDPERQMGLFPMHLSGGMRQRVVIAIALAGEPKLLIADEPTTALDVTIQGQILDLLGQLQRQRNMAIILITHELGVVSGFTDDVAGMYAGQIVERCSTEALLTRPRMPYSEALLKSVPALSAPPHTRLFSIPGLPPNLINIAEGCRFRMRCRYAQSVCRERMPRLSAEPDSDHHFACWNPLIHDEARG